MARKSSSSGADIIFDLIELVIYSGVAIWAFSDKPKRKQKSVPTQINNNINNNDIYANLSPAEKYQRIRKDRLIRIFLLVPIVSVVISIAPALILIDIIDNNGEWGDFFLISSFFTLAIILMVDIIVIVNAVNDIIEAKKEYLEKDPPKQGEEAKLTPRKIKNRALVVMIVSFVLLVFWVLAHRIYTIY